MDPDSTFAAGGIAGRVALVALLLVINGLLAAADAAAGSPGDEDARGPAVPETAARVVAALTAGGVAVLAGPVWFAAAIAAYIVAGELAPRVLGRERPDAVRRWVFPIARLLAHLLAPLTWLADGATRGGLRLAGIRRALLQRPARSPGELRSMVEHAHAQGELEETDRAMLSAVFDFKQKRASDVMRPRTEVVALDIDSTEDEVWRVLRTERYSRYPVYRDTLDDVVGVFLVKDLLLRDAQGPFTLAQLVREALYVPDSRAAARVLDDLRRTRAYMAVVLDEYGGTAGIITVEDLVEEVMGEITDEYDLAARTALEMDGILELAGTLSLIDARSDYDLDVPEGDWSTLGGFVFSQLGRLPKVGDRVAIPGAELEVVAMDGRRVAALRVHRTAAPAVILPARTGS